MDLSQFKISVFPLKNKLFRLAERLLDHHEDAQDVVQEVFLKLWNRREILDEYRSVEALAVVMTRNMCLDRIKTRKFPVEDVEKMKSEIVAPGSMDADSQDMIGRIRGIIGTLPEIQKTIMHLRDIEGYELEQIAAMMEMTENAVRVNLSRARKRVRDVMIKSNLYEYQRN
jgi:RNA polymerase sigma-70 factor, ECF subfamily